MSKLVYDNVKEIIRLIGEIYSIYEMRIGMTRNSSKILQAMHDSFMQENQELIMIRNNNNLRIDKIKELLNSCSKDTVGNDYIREKENLEYENQKNNNEINKLEQRIAELKEVISVGNFLDSLMLLDIQEKERKRIARDLHDTSLQNLTHLIHALELCSLFIDQDPAKAKLELEMAGRKIRVIIDDIRNTIYDLRPMEFDDLNLKDAIQNMVVKLQKDTDIIIELEMEKSVIIKNDLVIINIYRIIRECIINSIKHSGASEIKVKIDEVNEMCKIKIKDNGKGFDDLSIKGKRKHFGLQILEERVQLLRGKMNIYSGGAKDLGTRISITIPIIDKDELELLQNYEEV